MPTGGARTSTRVRDGIAAEPPPRRRIAVVSAPTIGGSTGRRAAREARRGPVAPRPRRRQLRPQRRARPARGRRRPPRRPPGRVAPGNASRGGGGDTAGNASKPTGDRLSRLRSAETRGAATARRPTSPSPRGPDDPTGLTEGVDRGRRGRTSARGPLPTSPPVQDSCCSAQSVLQYPVQLGLASSPPIPANPSGRAICEPTRIARGLADRFCNTLLVVVRRDPQSTMAGVELRRARSVGAGQVAGRHGVVPWRAPQPGRPRASADRTAPACRFLMLGGRIQ